MSRIAELSWRSQVHTGSGVTAEILDLVPNHAERAGAESLVLEAYRRIGVAAVWGPMPLDEAGTALRRHHRSGPGSTAADGGRHGVAGGAAHPTGCGGRGPGVDRRGQETLRGARRSVAGQRKTALIDHRGPLGEEDFTTAEAILAEACSTLETAGERSWFSTSIAVYASVLYELGRLDEAFEATIKSEESGAADDVVTQAYWRGRTGEGGRPLGSR